MERRPIGETDIDVSPVALGGWPITGITSLDVNETDSVATIRACLEHGINFVDTAYCYGANGESEKLIGRALGDRDEGGRALGTGWSADPKRSSRDARTRVRGEFAETRNGPRRAPLPAPARS